MCAMFDVGSYSVLLSKKNKRKQLEADSITPKHLNTLLAPPENGCIMKWDVLGYMLDCLQRLRGERV